MATASSAIAAALRDALASIEHAATAETLMAPLLASAADAKGQREAIGSLLDPFVPALTETHGESSDPRWAWSALSGSPVLRLANRQYLSPSSVDRMVSCLARHAIDKRGSRWDAYGKGRQAWDSWGGVPGGRWSRSIARRRDAAERRAASGKAAG